MIGQVNDMDILRIVKSPFKSNSPLMKNKGIIVAGIVVIAILSAIVAYQYPYLSYEKSLEKLESEIGEISCKKYASSNDWIYDLYIHNVDYNCDAFTVSFNQGKTLAQENELSIHGMYDNGFEDWSDKAKASAMCTVLSKISREAEDIYLDSRYYDKFGERLDDGETVSYRNNVTIEGFTTTYWLDLSILDTIFILQLDRDGNGTFVSKEYKNDKEYYYKYDLTYVGGKLETFQLISYSTPREIGYYDKTTGEMVVYSKGGSSSNSNSNSSNSSNSSSGSHGRTDYYNSGRYNDADSFADDYYEEFYDYEDYEDDDDAYDGAVDYWNEWNDD